MAAMALVIFALFALPAGAQTTAVPMPFVEPQFFNTNGSVCSGCMVQSWAAGTTTPQATFTDSTGATQNNNPVVLDAGGRANIWLSSLAYKLQLQTAAGVPIWTVDNVTVSNLGSVASITSRAANPAITGFLRLANGDIINWRNIANGGNIGLAQGGAASAGNGGLADVLRYGSALTGGIQANRFLDLSALPAQSGVLATGNNVCAVASRNVAANGDVCALKVDGSNNVAVGKVTITQPANGATVTVADGKTLAVNNSLTLAGADGTTQTFPSSPPAGGVLAYGVPKFQPFAASGVFTIPTGVTAVKVTVIGGGGAGGGATTTAGGGGGGGAGSAAIRWLSGLTPGSTITVTVGVGGTGVANGTGNSGSASSIASGTQFVATVTAPGAFGGAANGGQGSSGGVSTNGDINTIGGAGDVAQGAVTVGGAGGPSMFGGGGLAGTTGAGNPGGAPGAGGGGAGGSAGGAVPGGSGANGIVIFEWVN